MNARKFISFDWALKRLLRSKANYEVLEGFLSELLKEDLEILESESNRDRAHDRSNRVDIKVRNRKQVIILIEVQYEGGFDFLQRILFSTAKTVTEHLVEVGLRKHVVKVISIKYPVLRSGAWKRLYLSWQDPAFEECMTTMRSC